MTSEIISDVIIIFGIVFFVVICAPTFTYHMYMAIRELCMTKDSKWKEWYAWYPVRIQYVVKDHRTQSYYEIPYWKFDRIVWLETVYWRAQDSGRIMMRGPILSRIRGKSIAAQFWYTWTMSGFQYEYISSSDILKDSNIIYTVKAASWEL